MPRKKLDIKLKILQCKRCGYRWVPRVQEGIPKRCANCKSIYWDKKINNQKVSDRVKEWQREKWKGIREQRAQEKVQQEQQEQERESPKSVSKTPNLSF